MPTSEELRLAMLDLGFDLVKMAKISGNAREVADLAQAAADVLQAVSAADQKAATAKAMANLETSLSAALGVMGCPGVAGEPSAKGRKPS